MPFIHPNPDALDGTDLVGSKECVALLQHTMGVPNTQLWHQGEAVYGNPNIKKGTAIATFVNGHYPRQGEGSKHAAIYLSQDLGAIYVIDQWAKRGKVGARPIRVKSLNKDGSYYDPSNNALAFFVIETQPKPSSTKRP